MKIKRFFLLPFLFAGLLSCQGPVSSTSSLNSSSQFSSSNGSSLTASTSSEDKGTDPTKYVQNWVSAVSDTAPIMIAGKLEGKAVDYVVSSYPVILSAQAKNSNLTVVQDVAKLFGEKYSTAGFPQAGLFIRSSYESDASASADIEADLTAVDVATSDLIAGGTNEIQSITALGDASTQQSTLGFTAGVLQNCQKDSANKLAFLDHSNNPSLTGFSAFTTPLHFTITDDELSSYYPTKHTIPSTVAASTAAKGRFVSPMGAPAATLVNFTIQSNVTYTSPANVQATFAKTDATAPEYIIFDAASGLTLAKANGYDYKLVRMLTFGNLYVVGTNNDANATFEKGDRTVAFGENLIPGMAFKATFGA